MSSRRSNIFSLALLLVFSAVHVSAVSLIDALIANGASQFAATIEADPALLAFYLSNQVHTVWAPIDGYGSNNTGAVPLLRRAAAADTTSAEYQTQNTTTTMSGTTTKRKRSIDLIGDKNLEMNLPDAKLLPDNQFVIAEFALNNGSRPGRVRRDVPWSYTAPLWGMSAAPGPESPPASASGGKASPYSEEWTTTPVAPPAPPPETTSWTTLTEVPPPLPPLQWSTTVTPAPPQKWTTTWSQPPPPPPPTTVVTPVPSGGVDPDPPIKLSSGLGNRVDLLKADIPYDNGLIQLTNGYFTIPVLVSTTVAYRNLTTFLSLLNQANLTSIVDNMHRITVFVPTNSALAAVSASSSTPAQIQTLIYSHIVPNFLGYLPSLYNGLTLTTLANTTLTVTVNNGEYYVNGAHIIDPDVLTDNGVVNIIDQVLSPPPVQFTGGTASSRKPVLSLVLGIIALAFYLH